MAIIIRDALASDSQEIAQVSEHLGYINLSPEESHANLIALLDSPVDKVFVAQLSTRIVGWIHVFFARRLASNSFYEIGGLVVLPDTRGQGVGRMLVKHVLAHQPGQYRVRCNEVRTDAHAFYGSIGFKHSKVQHVFRAISDNK
ncbi:GNAT family N-acetyltransferase [Pseudoalteromonas rubra]|uniref:GNAT family N-acetyltransferase n=1 Tax=Pseudoalteromonas rubra TaxID=43658 RepID=A0A5S3UZM8_9GAMM|nr:GNAT family N-acetyltransferase [Pseudoalteromonas rubra]QPB83729.1 GNAT family N-acetyltransferase [Pseudoalteromonas rubra]